MAREPFRLDPRVNELERIVRSNLQIAGSYTGPVVQLNMPNLTCWGIDFSLTGTDGTDLHVTAHVSNAGNLRAPKCDVMALITVMPNARNTGAQSVVRAATCPPLDPGFAFQIEFDVVPNVESGQFASAMVIVDPPKPGKPGGDVWESREDDNICSNGVVLTFVDVPA
jgi:hypothetical protein